MKHAYQMGRLTAYKFIGGLLDIYDDKMVKKEMHEQLASILVRFLEPRIGREATFKLLTIMILEGIKDIESKTVSVRT